MNNRLHYGIDFSIKPINIFQTINQQINQVTANTKNMTYNFGESWKKLLSVNQALEGLRNLQSALDGAIQPGVALNSSLMDLSAITGLTGNALDGISDAARASARAFGTDAAQNVESYKLLLSQLSPDIAKSSDALKLMGDHVNTLSKTMSGNTIAATEVLTTAMNQYGVSLDNPMQASKTMAEMMNVMAAAAKEGSAELPQIKAALENVGMVAKTTGVTFSETNAAIQVLDKAGKKGAEGGVALRNTLSILSEGRFLPRLTRAALEEAGINIAQLVDHTTPLTARLNALKPIMNDTALVTKLFGKENAAAAIALINGSEDIDEYNRKIQGTNTAVDQAKVVMGSYAEHMKRVTAGFEDFKIGVFNATQVLTPYLQTAVQTGIVLGQTLSGLNVAIGIFRVMKEHIIGGIKAIKSFTISILNGTLQTRLFATWQLIASKTSRIFAKSIRGVRNAFLWATAGVRTFSLAVANIPVLGWIAIAVGAITASVIYLWENCRRFREIVYGIWEVCKMVFGKLGAMVINFWNGTIKPVFTAIGNFVSGIFSWIGDTSSAVWAGMVESVQDSWTTICHFFGSLWEGFKSMFSGFASFIDTWIVQPIAGAFSSLWNFICGLFEKIWSGLKLLFAPIIELWNKLFPEDGLKKIKQAWALGEKKGAASFDESKKQKTNNEAEEEGKFGSLPGVPKLETGKSNLKGFGSAAASAAQKSSKSESADGTSRAQSGNRSLTINKLVETLVVKVERLPESKERIKDAVAEALLLAVNDYNLAT